MGTEEQRGMNEKVGNIVVDEKFSLTHHILFIPLCIPLGI